MNSLVASSTDRPRDGIDRWNALGASVPLFPRTAGLIDGEFAMPALAAFTYAAPLIDAGTQRALMETEAG